MSAFHPTASEPRRKLSGRGEPAPHSGIQLREPARDGLAKRKGANMHKTILGAAAALACSLAAVAVAATSGPTDPQIAHIAYTAGELDVAAAKLALAKTRNATVRDFAQTMVRDHQAVNVKALALVKKLGVTPQANPVSASLSDQAAAAMKRLKALDGAAFDRAYATHEAGYHKTVNSALADTLIPSADNAELKSLLESGLALFSEHQRHAEHLAAKLK
jgi:putative membrane protein